MTKGKKSRKKSPSFEVLMEKLERIVKDLESGELSLEDSLAQFENGVEIFKQCRSYLEQAKQRVEVLIGREEDGGPLVEPYEEDVEEEEDE